MTDHDSRPAARDPHPKRPYQAPRIISREPLEAIAGACTPISEGGTGKDGPSCQTPGS